MFTKSKIYCSIVCLILVSLVCGCKDNSTWKVKSDSHNEALLNGTWFATVYDRDSLMEYTTEMTLNLNSNDHIFDMEIEMYCNNFYNVKLLSGGVNGQWRAGKNQLETISNDETAFVTFNKLVEAEISPEEIQDLKDGAIEELKSKEVINIVSITDDTLVLQDDDDEIIFHKIVK